MRSPGTLLNWREIPPELRVRAQCLEHRCSDCNGVDLFGVYDSRAAQIEKEERAGIAEQVLILAEIEVVKRGHAQTVHLKPREAAVDDNKLIRIRVGQGPEDDCVQRRKCRSGAPDSNSKYRDGRTDRQRRFSELPHHDVEIT